tara:strand:- start:16406 stop:16732 length:327 start_codon:yes stop_codon:yes gene_type:complete
MDFQDQLKNLFPNHQVKKESIKEKASNVWIQKEPLLCKYEKRKGKPITIIDGYNGSSIDFKTLTKEIKTKLSVGGSFKNNIIIIQGNYRNKIMDLLKEKGFSVKRVGG